MRVGTRLVGNLFLFFFFFFWKLLNHFENWFLVGCLKMIENRAVGTNGDIHRRKHASQGKKMKKKNLFFWEKLRQICRVGRVNRVGRVTPIKHFFLFRPYLCAVTSARILVILVRDHTQLHTTPWHCMVFIPWIQVEIKIITTPVSN